MFNSRLSSKINRDVQRYLKNQEPQQGGQPQPPTAVRREPSVVDPRKQVARTPQKTQFVQSLAPLQRQLSKSNKAATYQTDTIVINSNRIPLSQVQLRVISKKKEVVIQLSDAGEPKFKFEVKSESTVIDIVGATQLTIKSSKIQEYKNFNKERKWMLVNTYILLNKENAMVLTFPAAQLVKGSPAKPTLFDKLAEEEFMIMRDGEYIEGQNKQDLKQEGHNRLSESEDADQKIEFRPLLKQEMQMVERVKKNVAQIKDEDKVTLLTDVFKIKKQYENPNVEKRIRCPILTCLKTFQQGNQLKTHFKKYHPEHSKNGIEINDYGVLEYSQKSLDFALTLAKIFPSEVKKVIKRMKTKQTYEM